MSSPYECPRHRVLLVARVFPGVKLQEMVRNKRSPERVRYFACPHVEPCSACNGVGWLGKSKIRQGYCKPCQGSGIIACDFKKPDKWAKRRMYGKTS
jgi:DnaJ-class molecular chaperone